MLNFPIQVIEETHLITELIQHNDYLGEKKNIILPFRTSMKDTL